MSVPFIDLKRFEAGLHERWLDKVTSMTARAEFMGGPEVAALETGLSRFLQVEHAVSCANGTDAIQLALRALGVGRGDTVLVPNLTFWATFEAVVNVGADPATVDVDLRDGALDMDALRQALSQLKPKAVIIVHLYGWGSAQLSGIRALCKQHDVLLLEDGAQCFGATRAGASVLKDALISTTSFYPAKVLGAAGDGGAVFTNDNDLAARVRRLANHGRQSHYGYSDVGWNSRMDALQAAFLNVSLEYLEARIVSRRASATFYREKLSVPGVQVVDAPEGYVENGYCNVCLVPDAAQKAAIEAALKAAGIGFGNIYPGALSAQPGAEGVSKGHVGGNNAEVICASVLNLPLFPYMTSAELEQVVSVVSAAN